VLLYLAEKEKVIPAGGFFSLFAFRCILLAREVEGKNILSTGGLRDHP